MSKQVKIYDLENEEFHGGILLDDGNIICGCCGGLIEANEIGNGPDCTHIIVEVYNDWIDLDEEICGYDVPGWDEDGSFTAFKYPTPDSIEAEDLLTSCNPIDLIHHCIEEDWDEVVNDHTGTIMWHK